MSYPRYNSYKDSGVEWLGEIPEGWEVKKLKHMGSSIIGLTYSPSDLTTEEGIIILRAGNIQNGKIILDNNIFIDQDLVPEKLKIMPGDILICARSGSKHLVGKNAVVKENHQGLTFGAFMTVYRTNHWRYISQVLQSDIFNAQSELYLTTTINQLTNHTLNNMVIPFPSTGEERKAIADFLDRETGRIDTLISKKEQFITRLREKRQTVISHTVTRGLNPRAPLKDSGIPWLGKVPEHWEVKKLKYLGESIIGLTYKPSDLSDEENGTLLLRSTNIQKGKLVLYNNQYVKCEIPDRLTIRPGDILICSRNGSKHLIGKNTVLSKELEGSTFGAFMTVFRSPYWDFLSIVFQSEIFTAQSNLYLTTTINQLTIGTLNNLVIAFPPNIEERDEIIKEVSLETGHLDKIIIKSLKAISRLKEYKTALISAAVTGKIKVS